MSFFLRRAATALITLLALTMIVFVLARITGDPRALLLDESASREDFEAMGVAMGLDKPLYEQYGRFIAGAVTGDLGRSLNSRQPVAQMILARFPATLQLAAVAFVLTITVSTLLGVTTALRRGSWIDKGGRMLAVVGQSVPSFWLGIVLISIVSVQLRLLPTSGRGGWSNLILPAIVLSVLPIAAITRLTRGAMLEALDAEYVKLARLKGLSATTVAWVHCYRNAALVPLTYAGVVLANLLTGSIIVETVFAWPGIGLLALQSVQTRDFILLQGVVLVFGAIYVICAFLVDMLYGILDPRVRAT